jgi:hypothetical protein
MRFYRRRANEEMAAADRAVTEAARERRIQLAGIFLERLRDLEIRSAFDWADERRSNGSDPAIVVHHSLRRALLLR